MQTAEQHLKHSKWPNDCATLNNADVQLMQFAPAPQFNHNYVNI